MNEFPRPGPDTTSGLDTAPGLGRRLIVRLSQWYALLVLGRGLGPRLGEVTVELTDRNLRGSVPDHDPPAGLLEPARNTVYDSEPSEILGRANRWSAALESQVASGDVRVPAHTVLTTYGLVSFRTGIRLSIIHYLEPGAIFRLRHRPPAARIAGDAFPVVVRPAAFRKRPAPSRSQESLSLPGNIWLLIRDKKSDRPRLGYLTADHAVKDAQLGDVVTPDTYRHPPRGVLIRRSESMDSAVVATDIDPGVGFTPVRPSAVVGYKPVRMLTGGREYKARVVEHSGHVQGVILRTRGQRTLRNPALVMVSKVLSEGHSGCLVVDCEFEQHGMPAAPYAMYLAAVEGPTAKVGLCQLLEQPRLQWDLDFCQPREDEDDRKPGIG